MKAAHIHQIFYDEATRLALDPGFIPLDNSANPRPDWFEFFVIRDFLLRTPLEDDAWYAFLSPSFGLKTALRAEDMHGFLAAADADADVALFSHGWDQAAYFLNPFEQGEFWHPGLTGLCQQFLDNRGIDLNLRSYVAHSSSSVYSNFLAAKAPFWRQWLVLANALFEDVENSSSTLAQSLAAQASTTYGNRPGHYPMKAFIQERLACVLLVTQTWRVASADLSGHTPVIPTLFNDDLRTRRVLHACDCLKQEYLLARDEAYMDMYEKMRTSIALNCAIPSPFL